MAAETRTFTADDLLRMSDNGFRYELLEGELKRMPPAGHIHGRIAAALTASLLHYVKANELGAVFAAETGFKIGSSPDTVRAPDVAFVTKARMEVAGESEGYFPGAPDLAVEVVSANDIYGEVEDKVFEWLAAGTRLVIVVNSRTRTITAFRSFSDIRVLTEQDTLDAGDVVPGWMLPVHLIFE
jgi:Uma2 family endonuclease